MHEIHPGAEDLDPAWVMRGRYIRAVILAILWFVPVVLIWQNTMQLDRLLARSIENTMQLGSIEKSTEVCEQ
jgi:hypothetical protein